jgi:uncharacterized membrane protein
MPETSSTTAPVFYSHAWLYFLLAMAVIIAGFVPSFFTKLPTTDAWHHLHGMTATAWLTLLVVQPFLYRRGNLKLHRKLGKISYLLVPMLAIGGTKMIQLMIQRRMEYPPLEAYRLAFIDTVSLIFFITFFVLAIQHVRTTALHARYLASTVILLLPPGLGRLLFNTIPAVNTFSIDLHICFVIMELAILLLLLDDKRRDGHFSKPYLQLAAVVVGIHLCLPFVSNWSWWQQLTLSIFG